MVAVAEAVAWVAVVAVAGDAVGAMGAGEMASAVARARDVAATGVWDQMRVRGPDRLG